MKEVFIDGIIGYEWIDDACITAKKIKKQLAKLEDGEEIKITIDSPGGSVSEGVVIFNLIRDYAKEHPVSTRINCKALSMASYIALAARTVNKTAKVTASENSTMMIHNPYGAVVGDYRKMKNSADYLEKLAVLYGSVHSGVAGRPDKEIRDAMDKETFYVGKEIQEIGFANDFEIIIENDTNGSAMGGGRDALIANARLELDRAIMKDYEAKAKDPVAYLSEFDKMVALFNVSEPPAAESAKTSGKNNFGGCMTPEELKAQNKALYDAIFAQGEAAGIEKERARVNAHLLLGEKSGSLAIAAKFIKSGVSTNDETAQAEYYAAKLDNIHLADRDSDNVGDVATGGEGGGDVDNKKLEAAFMNGFQGRDKGGSPWAE